MTAKPQTIITASPLIGPPSLRSIDSAITIITHETVTLTLGDKEEEDDGIVFDPDLTLSDKEEEEDDGIVFDPDDENPITGFTENMSATFLATGNPCLDFFFQVVPDTPSKKLIRLLQTAWAFNPLTALKLICNLRGVRGTGKTDKEGFYTAALWLYDVHPKTLAGNVKAISEFGYFKDFLEILYRIIEGPSVRKTQKDARKTQQHQRVLRCRRINMKRRKHRHTGRYHIEMNPKQEKHWKYTMQSQKKEGAMKALKLIKRLVKGKKEEPVGKEEARALRKEKERNQAKKALDIYNGDEDYRLLHDSVSSLFVELLTDDIEKMISSDSDKLKEISLAAKWCPTVDSSYDKTTLICESIARKMFPRDKYPEYVELEEGHYVYRVRDRLRKEVLVPLHKALELPEVYMSSSNWNTLPYNRVPSVAMTKYTKLFEAHDKERFQKYLEDVKNGKAKIAAGALLPHEIIKAVQDDEGREVAELQWKRLVDDMTQKGTLSNCIAVCDVSGSMYEIPMEVSIALGVLVSELSQEPWKGKVITFSEDPELQKVEGESLYEKTEFVRYMDWGGSTDFQGVFDKILEVAVEWKLKEEELVKQVFVFSDMEFDEASCNPWETDYKVIQKKYAENGYKKVPEIVFWNLRNSSSVPVACNEPGVALVSGYSKNLLKIFIDGGGIVNPVEIMEVAISREEYKKLAVFD